MSCWSKSSQKRINSFKHLGRGKFLYLCLNIYPCSQGSRMAQEPEGCCGLRGGDQGGGSATRGEDRQDGGKVVWFSWLNLFLHTKNCFAYRGRMGVFTRKIIGIEMTSYIIFCSFYCEILNLFEYLYILLNFHLSPHPNRGVVWERGNRQNIFPCTLLYWGMT